MGPPRTGSFTSERIDRTNVLNKRRPNSLPRKRPQERVSRPIANPRRYTCAGIAYRHSSFRLRSTGLQSSLARGREAQRRSKHTPQRARLAWFPFLLWQAIGRHAPSHAPYSSPLGDSLYTKDGKYQNDGFGCYRLLPLCVWTHYRPLLRHCGV